MKRFFKEIRLIVLFFLVWRATLFFVSYLAQRFVVFGARYPYANRALEITGLPSWVWGFGGFDGVHYLRIAQNGYGDAFTQAFFPIFPLLISLFSNIFPKVSALDRNVFVDPSYFYSGLILSNIFTILFLYTFYKLLKLDLSHKKAVGIMTFVLLFPTAFYFGSIYTESLFLFLTVLTFYLLRQGKFFLAGLIASLASGVRFVGVFLFVAILWEFYITGGFENIGKRFIDFIGLVISPLGTVFYMLYLWKNYSDPLLFITAQSGFGAQRSSSVVLLPQVLWRYGKIFLSVSPSSLEFFNAALEVGFTILVIYVLITTYKKARKSYWLFALLASLVPTLTGSLSSMPRYSLVILPLLPWLPDKLLKSNVLRVTMFAILVFLTILFVRGYWVA